MPRETGVRASSFSRVGAALGAPEQDGVVKRLLLLRHAKAVPHGTANDFDRTLAKRGREDMEAIARHIGTLDPAPDLALVSPAARARETWSLCGLPDVKVRFEEAIYEASVGALWRLVQALPDDAKMPILVGHNPSFEDVAAMLEAETPLRGLPTAGLVLAEWDATRWREAELAAGRLVDLVTPSSLGGAPGA